MDNVLVGALCIGGILFTYWYFLTKSEDLPVEASTGRADIIVEGGYSPASLTIPLNQKTTLSFLRKDSSSCLEEVVLPDFKIRTYLPLNKKVSVDVYPTKPGTYEISCGMNMFHGKLIVTT